MSYLPEPMYYAFISLKVGDYDVSHVPPEHIQALTIERIINKGFSKASLSLYDQTALKVEYELARGITTCELQYGYIGDGPKSPKYTMQVADWTTSFNLDGSTSLEVEFVSKAANSMANPKADSYKGMSIEEILLKIAKEENWIVLPDSIEPIRPVNEPDPTVGSGGTNDQSKTKPKEFIRSNMAAPQFIQQVLAPACVSARSGLGDYQLWFSDVAMDSNDVDSSDVIDQFATAGGFVGDTAKKLQQMVKDGKIPKIDLKQVTHPSTEDIKNGLGSMFTQSGAVMPGMGGISGIVSDKLKLKKKKKSDDVTAEDQSNNAEDSEYKEKVDPKDMPIMYFKPRANYEHMVKKDPNNSKSDDFLSGIPQKYRFEWGTGKGSTVLTFAPSYNGALFRSSGGGTVTAAVIDKVRNVLLKYKYDKTTDEMRPVTGENEPTDRSGSEYVIDVSSCDMETLRNLAANQWYKMAGKSYKASMEIFGDPTIDVNKQCSILVLTKNGVPHHSSGIYVINGVTDTIQGGSFSTSLELTRNGMTIGDNGAGGLSIKVNPAPQGTPKVNGMSMGGEGVATNAMVEQAVQWCLATAADDSHGYSLGGWGPDYDCASFVLSGLKAAGLDISGATNCTNMVPVLQSRGFQWIDMGSVGELQRGDILVNPDSHTELCVGGGQIVGAHSNHDSVQGDSGGQEISIRTWGDGSGVDNNYGHGWSGVLRLP